MSLFELDNYHLEYKLATEIKRGNFIGRAEKEDNSESGLWGEIPC